MTNTDEVHVVMKYFIMQKKNAQCVKARTYGGLYSDHKHFRNLQQSITSAFQMEQNVKITLDIRSSATGGHTRLSKY